MANNIMVQTGLITTRSWKHGCSTGNGTVIIKNIVNYRWLSDRLVSICLFLTIFIRFFFMRFYFIRFQLSFHSLSNDVLVIFPPSKAYDSAPLIECQRQTRRLSFVSADRDLIFPIWKTFQMIRFFDQYDPHQWSSAIYRYASISWKPEYRAFRSLATIVIQKHRYLWASMCFQRFIRILMSAQLITEDLILTRSQHPSHPFPLLLQTVYIFLTIANV